MSKCWVKVDLPNGRFKITIPSEFFYFLPSQNTVLVQSGWVFEIGDILILDGIERKVKRMDYSFGSLENFNRIIVLDENQ